MKRKLKIGLALGSGGARGMAHLGVLRALREAGIEADLVAGTSSGALVGMSYAAGRLESMTDVVENIDWRQALSYFMEARLPHSGLIDGIRVLKFIRHYTRGRRLEDLAIPFAAVATDLASGGEVVLKAGEADRAIRASLSIPGLFTPVNFEGRFLVDGGLVNPVPVNVVRKMGADFVIAVDVVHFEPLTADQMTGRRAERKAPARGAPRLRKWVKEASLKWRERATHSFLAPMLKAVEEWDQEPGLFDVLGIALRIMESQIAERRFREEPADYLIRPKLGNVFFMEFHRSPEIVKWGYEAGRAAAPEILRLLKDRE
jgi:NTE family protein